MHLESFQNSFYSFIYGQNSSERSKLTDLNFFYSNLSIMYGCSLTCPSWTWTKLIKMCSSIFDILLKFTLAHVFWRNLLIVFFNLFALTLVTGPNGSLSVKVRIASLGDNEFIQFSLKTTCSPLWKMYEFNVLKILCFRLELLCRKKNSKLI
jgi:hypothetical protein